MYLAFKGQDIQKIWLEIKTANFFWLGISAITLWLAHVLRARRWQMLYNSIQYRVTLRATYHAVIIGYLANLALPRFGEIARCSVIRKTSHIPVFASLGTVITERLFDVLILLLTSLLMLLFQYSAVASFIHTIWDGLTEKTAQLNFWWLLIAGTALVFLLFACFYLLKKKFSDRFLRILVSLKQGFGSYSKLKHKKLFLLYTGGIWFLYLLSMYFAFLSLHATENLGLNAAFTALVFSGFAMVAPVQGGIGVFHWMVAQSLLLYSISFNDGLAYATLLHSTQFLLTVLLGIWSLIIVAVKDSKKDNSQTDIA